MYLVVIVVVVEVVVVVINNNNNRLGVDCVVYSWIRIREGNIIKRRR